MNKSNEDIWDKDSKLPTSNDNRLNNNNNIKINYL